MVSVRRDWKRRVEVRTGRRGAGEGRRVKDEEGRRRRARRSMRARA